MLRTRLARTGAWLCLGGAALGALGLFGWISGTSLFTTIVPGLPPMVPNTALALLLIGCAGAARQGDDTGRVRKVLSLLATLVVLALGVVTLAEYGLGIDLAIDHLFANREATVFAGRSSPPTAFALTCLAAALLLADVRATARVNLSEWLVLVAGLTAWTALTGIILGAAPLYRLTRAPLIGQSLPTAISLLLTSLGVLLARPTAVVMRVATSPGPGGLLLRRLALPAILVPLGLGLVVTRLSGAQEVAIPVAILAAAMAAVSLVLIVVTARPLDRAHENVEASRTRTRNLFELAPDGIFVADIDGRYIDVNEAGCRLLEYSREEIVGRAIIDFVPPDDVERLRQARELLLMGMPHVGEWRLRRKDGSYVPVEVSANIIPDGRWQGFVRDITEQKRLEKEQRFLAEVGARLVTTLEYEETLTRIAEIAVQDLADCCMLDLVDEKGEVRRQRIVCRDPSKAVTCDKRLLVSTHQTRPCLVRSALESRQPVVVQRLSSDDVEALALDEDQLQTLRRAEARSAVVIPLVAPGSVLGAITLLYSNRSRMHGPDDLRVACAFAQRAALAVDNARLYRAAQRAIQARNEVLGVVAHDLRNPLSLIQMEAVSLQRDKTHPERPSREPGEVITRAATHMNRLIEDLLDVSAIDAGGLTIAQSRVSAAHVAIEAVDAQRRLRSAESLELRLELADNLPEISADRDRLLQVFENLIGNAIKFTPPGGSITVGAVPRDAHVQFCVKDSGSGIALEDRAHLFDRFWQRHPTRHGGAGLGLPIVKGIVEAHGGDVWIDSAPGRGTKVFFTIPAAHGVELLFGEPEARRGIGGVVQESG